MRLIDKDELFNSIFNELEDEEGCMHICKAGLLDMIDEFPEVEQWISVKNRLPEKESDVLAYLVLGEETRIIPANYYNNEWFDCAFNCYVSGEAKVTHWMPLPEPPKEE